MFTNILSKALLSRREKEAGRFYIGASQVGHPCLRKTWYEYNQAEKDREYNAEELLRFCVGDAVEKRILKIIDKYNDEVKTIRPPLLGEKEEGFLGTPDAIMLVNGVWIIVEIKTAKNSSFNAIKKNGLRASQPTYWAQTQAYLGLASEYYEKNKDTLSWGPIEKTQIFVFNKDTSETYEESIFFDSFYFSHLRDRAKIIKDSDTAPTRLSENKAHYLCNMCSFKKRCHGEK